MSVAAVLGLAMLAAVVDWWAVFADREPIERIAKPAVMVLLIGGAALADLDLWPRLWLSIALLAGLVGDVLLLPAVDRFIAGLAAFLGGHLAYVALALSLGTTAVWLGIGLALSTLLVVTVGSAIVAAVRGSSLAVPVTAYVVVIGVATAMLIGTGLWPVVAGAASFAASDALLGWNRFVEEVRGGRVAVHIAYHAAQVLVTVGVLTA